MIHAPSCAFVTATTSSTTPVTSAPTPLMAALVLQPGPRSLRQCTTMPACDKVNDRNTPIMYSGISACVSPAKTHEQQRRKCAEPENAVRKREPVTLVHELARQIAVAGEDRRQARKIRVGRVGRQHQDQHRRRLHQVVRNAAPAEDATREL